MQDALAVTDALRARFGQDRIYLMGHSYGTFIGLLCAQAAPENTTPTPPWARAQTSPAPS